MPRQRRPPPRFGALNEFQPPALLETYCATAWICAPDRRPENDGMTPAPLRTIAATVAGDGLSWSRFGPVVPLEPAALSVWQPPQPALEKTWAPDAGAPPAAPPPLAAPLFCAPISSGPTSRTTTANAATSQVTGGTPRSTRASTSERREAVVGDEPEAAGQPHGDEQREQQAAGDRQRRARQRVGAHDHHLRRERAVEEAAEQRVEQHPRRACLEGELVEAVVGDREAEEEREAARDPVRAADPRRRLAQGGQPPVHPQRREELDQGEEHGEGREPDLHRDRVLEAQRDR